MRTLTEEVDRLTRRLEKILDRRLKGSEAMKPTDLEEGNKKQQLPVPPASTQAALLPSARDEVPHRTLDLSDSGYSILGESDTSHGIVGADLRDINEEVYQIVEEADVSSSVL